MATHSNILAWRIPETEEPGGLPSMGSHRVDTTEATQQQDDAYEPLKRMAQSYADITKRRFEY